MRRYRGRRRSVRRRVIRKQRIFKRRRAVRQFVKPDGVSSVKFTFSVDVQRASDSTAYLV